MKARPDRDDYLRREMLKLSANWPTGPGAIPEPTQAEKERFVEAFIRTSRPFYERFPPAPPPGTQGTLAL
jgi:hypothetical protein